MSKFDNLNVEPTYLKEYVWEQMFRPKTTADVALPPDFRAKFDKYIEDKRLPSMIFYSPKPGTGKTTTARALCNDIGCTSPMFINASLDNSIESIRTKVYQYGSTVSIMDSNQKVVILDECERLSQAAQESLKGLMEELSKNCTFILTTNDISRVDSRLVSRCRRYDFVWDKTQERVVMMGVLRRIFGILNNRGIPFDDKAITTLVKRSFPDNRSLLGTLQDYADSNGKIDLDILNHIGGFNFNGVIDIIRDNDFKKAAEWAAKYHEQQGAALYGAMFRYLCPYDVEGGTFKIKKTGVPALCLILNEAQKPKNVGPDTYTHLVATLLEIITHEDIRPA